MRIPLFILCLAVIYGTCKAYNEEDVNLIEGVTNDENYKLDYSNVPFERSLSRQKRTIAKLPLLPLKLIIKLLRLENNALIKPMLKPMCDIITTGLGILSGQIKCPEKPELSIETIKELFRKPVTTSKAIICYVLDEIGATGRALMARCWKIFWQFIRTIFLPGLHNILNKLNDTGKLPPSVSAMIGTFNVCYGMLKLLGYVG